MDDSRAWVLGHGVSACHTVCWSSLAVFATMFAGVAAKRAWVIDDFSYYGWIQKLHFIPYGFSARGEIIRFGRHGYGQ